MNFIQSQYQKDVWIFGTKSIKTWNQAGLISLQNAEQVSASFNNTNPAFIVVSQSWIKTFQMAASATSCEMVTVMNNTLFVQKKKLNFLYLFICPPREIGVKYSYVIISYSGLLQPELKFEFHYYLFVQIPDALVSF